MALLHTLVDEKEEEEAAASENIYDRITSSVVSELESEVHRAAKAGLLLDVTAGSVIDIRMENHESIPTAAAGVVLKDDDGLANFFGENHNADNKASTSEVNGGGDDDEPADTDMMVEVESSDAVENKTEPTEGKCRERVELLTINPGQEKEARISAGSNELSREDNAMKIRKLELIHEQNVADTTNTIEENVNIGNAIDTGEQSESTMPNSSTPVEKISASNTSASLTDIYGRTPGKEPKYTIVCPNCGRHLSSSRLSNHLEKCMGLLSSRRNSVSAANGVKKRLSSKGSTSSNEDKGSGDSKVNKQSQAKRKSKDT